MNSVLSYLAGFLVLLLFAALVGPSVVDWNSFRGEIEAQVSKVAGTPVSIDGDINFVILPAPRFSLERLHVDAAGSTDAAAPDRLGEIGRLEGEIALAPLLRGEIEVTRVRILDFSLRVKRDEEGRINWAQSDPGSEVIALDPSTISLDAAQFENGTVQLIDAVNGYDISLTGLGGDLKAVSLLGPLRIDGAFYHDAHGYEFSATLGMFGGNRAFPVNIEIREPSVPWQASFTGLATDASATARLDGTVQFSLGVAPEEKPEEATKAPINVQAGAVISRESISLRDVELAIAGSVLKGQAGLTFDDIPTLAVDFKGPRLVADRLIAELAPLTSDGGVSQIPTNLQGSIDLELADVSLGRLSASDVAGHFLVAGGAVTVQSLAAQFPGDTTAIAKGELSVVQGSPRFDGAMEVSVGSLPGLGRWLERRLSAGDQNADGTSGDPDGPAYQGPQGLRLQTELALQPSLWQAYSMTAILSEGTQDLAPVTGGFSYARSSRPAMGVELKGPLLDFNFLGTLAQLESWSSSADLTQFDASLVVAADRIRLGALDLRDLDLAAALNNGHLSIAKFEARNGSSRNPDEERVSFTGSLNDLGRFATGGIEGRADASLVADLLRQRYMGLLPEMGAGQLDFVLRGDIADERHLLTLDVSGDVDGSDAALVLKQVRQIPDGSLAQFDFLLSLQNESAGDLVSQVGLGGGESLLGEGGFQAQISGAGAGPFDASVRLRAGETSLSAKGQVQDLWQAPLFTGRFEASSNGVQNLFSVAGWQGGLVDLIVANGRDGAVIAGGALEWSRQRAVVDELEAVAGTFRVSGRGSYESNGDVPEINAALTIGRVSLDSLFVTEDGSLWNANPVNWRALDDFQGVVSLTSTAVEVAGLSFSDVAANASLGEGVLSFNPVTAQFAGGRLTMGGKFEGGAGVPGVGLTVALEDASVADVSKMISGESLAEGVVTIGMQMQGQGRSMLGLVSSLAGKGTAVLGDGAFSNFDLAQFRGDLMGLSDMDAFDELESKALNGGATAFDSVEGALQLEDGLLDFGTTIAGVSAASVAATKLHADLVRLEVDIESNFILDGEPPLPPLTMVVSGQLRDLQRRTDTLAIQSAVAQALLVREMEAAGVDELPDELRELIAPPAANDNLDVPIDDEAAAGPEETENDESVRDSVASPGVPLPAARPAP